jgi:hypothetical protein
VFWEEIDGGKTERLIRHAKVGADASLLFTEFYEKYLNEYAISWGMRHDNSPLYAACKSYGVDSVTPCLQVLLVFEAARSTKCPLTGC